jgi:hypothetical protein
MEEHFLGGQPEEVVTCYEALRFGSIVEFGEMGERSSFKSEWNTLALDILLTDATHDLWYVNISALRTGAHHVLYLVLRVEVFECNWASFVSCQV